MSIIADSINNLTDFASSITAFIGFKISKKPANEKHPFGHGRVEYISAIIISFIILYLGIQLLISSVTRLFSPQDIYYSIYTILILVITVVVKIFLAYYYYKCNKIIGSHALKAAQLDSINDSLATAGILIGIFLSNYSSLPFDTIIAIIISLIIIYNGITILKETISTLIGEKPNPELKNNIEQYLKNTKEVINFHEMIIHDYGPENKLVTVHVEMPCTLSIVEAHKIIDNIERELGKQYNISLLIHIDPIESTLTTEKYKQYVNKSMQHFPQLLSFHDFRVSKENSREILFFDVIVDQNIDEKNLEKTKKNFVNQLHQEFEDKDITFFISYERKGTFTYDY
jgi:cation diffusion facilitator family transporter